MVAHSRENGALDHNRRRLNQGHRPPDGKPRRRFCLTRGPPRNPLRGGEIKRRQRSRKGSVRHRWSGARGHTRSAGLESRYQSRGVPLSRLAEDRATAAACYLSSRHHRRSSHCGAHRSKGISTRHRIRHAVADDFGHLPLSLLLSSLVCHLCSAAAENFVENCELFYHGAWGAKSCPN